MHRPHRLLAPIVLLLLGLATAPAGHAQVDPWEFETYPYQTTPRGMLEFEVTNAYVASGHTDPGEGTSGGLYASRHQWFNAYELTYGLTDRIEAAVYLTADQPADGSFQRAGHKLRLRGRLFDQGVLPVDIGWYAELEWHKSPQFDDAPRELELRPILEKDFGRLIVMLNPKFEKVLSGEGRHQGFEFGYAASVQYRWSRRLSPSLEFYGGSGLVDDLDPLRDQQHYVFPSVWGELPGGLEYNVGVGFGLTPASDHVIFKVNLELERFVSALFHASREGGWFF